ncbi:bifunctional NAD(P)H-hydrate repair enzyme Nnr [Clostridia bacterium]|nr:bifunctional NAD(P)H-hydrate repair enzyme Nnr [Clostridia bacterium]
MKSVTIAQMREIERLTFGGGGVTAELAMENAGGEAARRLFCAGGQVRVLFPDGTVGLRGDALGNYNRLIALGVPICERLDLSEADVIIDALLGIGARGAPTGGVKAAIEAINNSGARVVAVDLPSGVNADTGAVDGVCVQADVTVTFGLMKNGLALYPAAGFAGEVRVWDVSFAPDAVAAQRIDTEVMEGVALRSLRPDAHKGTKGKLFALCGSAGLSGAAYLSASAAMRAGCGTVTLGVPRGIQPVLAAKLTEVMTRALDDRDGVVAAGAIPEILRAAANADAVLCGCGLGRSPEADAVVVALAEHCNAPLILDADGINAITSHTDILRSLACDIAVTPHPGEMSRLTGLPVANITGDPLAVTKAFASEYHVITVLKGASTVIALPGGAARIIKGGNPAMGTAGSGDVLAGVIASLAAQGYPLAEAAATGAYLHARAGAIAASRSGRGTIAGDILDSIPQALREVD